MVPRLAQRIAQAPKTPGVYFWRGRGGRPLYIGKATDLRNRLASYPKSNDPRIQAMMEESLRLDWQETPTEIDALIEESRLIKGRRPKYNVVMRDDKQYTLVALTDEEFPQLIVTHQVQSRAIRKPVRQYLGPFTDAGALRATLHALRWLFPTCSCKTKHHVQCLNAHIGRCPGFCCLKSAATTAEKRRYARNVRAVTDILTGKRATVIRRIAKDDPETAFRIMQVFRHAQVNRRRQALASRHVGSLEELIAEFGFAGAPARIEGYDVAAIHGIHAVGAMVVFLDGSAAPSEYRLFNINGIEGDVPMLRHMLERRLAHAEWPLPDLMVVDGARGQMNAALKALAALGLTIPVIAVTKDARHRPDHVLSSLDLRARPLASLPPALRNLLVHVDAEAHRFSISRYRRRHRRVAAGGAI